MTTLECHKFVTIQSPLQGNVFWTKEELQDLEHQAMIDQTGFVGKAINFMGMGKWI
jgi:hypothetical protein